MGIMSKLGLKKKKVKPGEKKHQNYESVDVDPKKYSDKRGSPELVVADAPSKPTFGGKGLQSDTVYKYENGDEDDQPHQHQIRTVEGKSGLKPFGQPPESTKAEAEGPGTNSEGKSATKDAMDAVHETGGTTPGQQGTGAGQGGTAPALGGKTKSPEQEGLGSGNAPVGESDSDPVVPHIPERPGVVVSVIVVLKVALGIYLALMALFMLWLRPSFDTMFWSILLGVAGGLGYSWLFYSARYMKRLLNNGFNIQPGRKGMIELLGQVPSWISFQEKERVQWANLAMAQMWQYYDRAICDAIKESVEPIMDQYKPPGIVKKIYFKRMTFGDLPITIDDVWVENEGEKHILLEMAFRLSGHSNIEIAVELSTGTGTKLVPKVTDLHVSGVARIILAPLLPEIPGFGAMVFSLKRPPLIHFNLNFGSALGGGASAALAKMWLDPFLRDTLSSLIVWPNRIVFPMLPESPENNLDDLTIHNVGLLQVTVVEARDLDKQDLIGKSDPLVECWTQRLHVEATSHKTKTLNPSWNEGFHFLVQEPKTQFMRLQVYDWDGIHLKEVLSTINIVKGIQNSFGAKTFMARAAVEIRPFLDEAGQEVDKWYDLGRNHWSHEDGTGKGHGSIRLKARYWPFDMLYSKPRDASMGAVLIVLKSAKDLPAADNNGLSDPYCKLLLAGSQKKSVIQYDTLSPVWNEKHDFVKVPIKDVLRIEVWDDDPVDFDDKLGIVEISIKDEVAPANNSTIEKMFFLKDVPKDVKTKEDKRATITLKVQWVPFDFDPEENDSSTPHSTKRNSFLPHAQHRGKQPQAQQQSQQPQAQQQSQQAQRGGSQMQGQ